MAGPIKRLTPEAEAARNIDDGIKEGAANAAALDEAFMPLYPYMYFRPVGWAAMCALGFIHANLAGCMSIPHGQKRKRNELSVNTTTRPPCPCHPEHRKVAGLVSLDGSSPCPHDLATRAMRRAKCSCSFSLLALLPLPVPPLFAVSTRGPFYSPHSALSNPLPPSRRIGFSSSSLFSHP